MSDVGDKMFEKMLRVRAGIDEYPVSHCRTCGRAMGPAIIPDFAPQCDECRNAEWEAERAKAPPPVYDIDGILDQSDQRYWMILERLARVSEGWCCPDSKLLAPEIIIRDFGEIWQFYGSRFDYIIQMNHGLQRFLRGQRAAAAIGAHRLEATLSALRRVLEDMGIEFPDPIPDFWHGCPLVDLDQKMAEIRPILADCPDSDEVGETMLSYLKAHRQELRVRKSGTSESGEAALELGAG